MPNVPTNYEGPVCNLNSKLDIPQPTAPTFPQIPIATDQASTQAAVNAMRQFLQNMFGDTAGPNNIFFGGGGGQGGGGGGGGGGNRPNPQPKPTDFVEVPGTRVTENVRVFNPDDNSQYVDVQQVKHVQFANKMKQKLTYSN